MGRFIFKLPDVGEGTAEAEIVAWHVAVGDRVHEDQQIVDVMTDKATVEMTSPVTGTVVALKGRPGEMATVGAPLVEFELEGGDAKPAPAETPEPSAVEADRMDKAMAGGGKVQAAPAVGKVQAAPAVGKVQATPAGGGKVLAAPAVRLRAADLGIDLANVRGSGPAGRVTHGDLDDFLSSRGAPAAKPVPVASEEFDEVKLIGLRRRIAEKMTEAKRRIPHFAYVEEIDMTELEALRAQLNGAKTQSQPKLTVLPFLMRAVVRAVAEFPQVNAHFDDEAGVVKRFKAVHIGIATQTDAGLTVPVIRQAQCLDLWDAANAVARVAAAARDNSAAKDALSGSTITITSLGALGGIAATPIINHPEVAILCPNRIVERPVVRGGQIAIRRMMNLSSSFDHRVVDGADAAAFVQRLKTLLEHPALLFV